VEHHPNHLGTAEEGSWNSLDLGDLQLQWPRMFSGGRCPQSPKKMAGAKAPPAPRLVFKMPGRWIIAVLRIHRAGDLRYLVLLTLQTFGVFDTFSWLSYTRYTPRWFREKPWPTFRCPLAYCDSARLWEDLANLSLPSAKHNVEAQVKDLAFFDSGSLADLGIQTSTAMAFDTKSVTHLPGRRQATRWYPQPKLVACPAQPIPIISDISTAPATPHGFQGSAG